MIKLNSRSRLRRVVNLPIEEGIEAMRFFERTRWVKAEEVDKEFGIETRRFWLRLRYLRPFALPTPSGMRSIELALASK